MHVTACSAALEFENSKRHGSVAQQLRFIGDEERVRNRKCIESLIRCTHFLVRHHIPHTTNYDGLIELVVDCGAPYLAQFFFFFFSIIIHGKANRYTIAKYC